MNIVREYETQPKLAFVWRSKSLVVPAINVLAFAKTLASHIGGCWARQNSNCAVVTLTYGTMHPHYEVLFTCKIDGRTREFSVTSTLTKNAVPVRVASSTKMILLSRHFNRLNTDTRYFVFRVNPLTREFSLKQTTLFTKSQFEQTIGNNASGIEYIATEMNSAMEFMRYNFYLVLVQMGELHSQYLQVLQENKEDFRGFTEPPQVINKQFSQLNHINLISNIAFDWMAQESLKRYTKLTQEELKEVEQQSKQKLKLIADAFDRTNPAAVVRYLRTYNHESEIHSQELRSHNRQRVAHLTTMLLMRQPKSSTEIIYQLQKIEIEEAKDRCYLPLDDDETISSKRIVKEQLTFCNRPLEAQDLEQMGVGQPQLILRRFQTRVNEGRLPEEISRAVCWRQQEDPAVVQHQKRVLSYIMYCCSQHIGRYYFSTQLQFRDRLYVDYYPSASLETYRQKNSLCFSLLSKLFLLSQACNGMRFLHDNKIYLLNFQLKNIMMGKGFLTRIVGFEQAYHPAEGTEFNRIVESPYSAPELYSEHPLISEKADVYSFGVAMCELIFCCKPHEIADRDVAIAAYSQRSYYKLFGVTPDRARYHGPQEYVYTLLNLVLRCVHPDPNQRPLLDWIVIFLKESITYVDLLY